MHCIVNILPNKNIYIYLMNGHIQMNWICLTKKYYNVTNYNEGLNSVRVEDG